MFFDTWSGLVRVVVVATLTYAALVTMLRISGSRTLAKLNAFDLVVTVALGSTLATTLLSKDTPLAEGVLALAMLIGLQWVVAWASVRSAKLRGLVKSEPTLVALRGEFLHAAMRKVRITEEEIDAALRSAGCAALSATEAVVMETDGSVTVIRRDTPEPCTALENLKGYPSCP